MFYYVFNVAICNTLPYEMFNEKSSTMAINFTKELMGFDVENVQS